MSEYQNHLILSHLSELLMFLQGTNMFALFFQNVIDLKSKTEDM